MTQTRKPGITHAVSQITDAADQIKAAADELGVMHAVLSTHVADPEVVPDALAAIVRAERIAQQLAETADALDKTAELLRQVEAGREH